MVAVTWRLHSSTWWSGRLLPKFFPKDCTSNGRADCTTPTSIHFIGVRTSPPTRTLSRNHCGSGAPEMGTATQRNWKNQGRTSHIAPSGRRISRGSSRSLSACPSIVRFWGFYFFYSLPIYWTGATRANDRAGAGLEFSTHNNPTTKRQALGSGQRIEGPASTP
jgi:hypothetical protein